MPEIVGPQDLTALCRQEYLYAVELARVQHDPTADWEGFRDTLWSYLLRVFGMDTGEPWPEEIPDPRGRGLGDAREVAAWMREQLDEVQRPGATPRSD